MIKKVFAVGIAIVVLTILSGYILLTSFLYPYGHELDVTIQNATDSQVTKLYLTYRGLDEDILVESIDVAKSYHTRISATENIDESDLTLYYYDDNNTIHEHTVIGYFEGRGGGQASVVNIESIDENGVLDITVDIIRP